MKAHENQAGEGKCSATKTLRAYLPFTLDDSPAAQEQIREVYLRLVAFEMFSDMRKEKPRVDVVIPGLATRYVLEAVASRRTQFPLYEPTPEDNQRLRNYEREFDRNLRAIAGLAIVGNTRATAALWTAAGNTLAALEIVSEQGPEAVRSHLSAIQEHFHALRRKGFGTTTRNIRHSSATPRRYAEAVRETLESNRVLQAYLRELTKGGHCSYLSINLDSPAWAARCAMLAEFNRNGDNFESWWNVAEDMLKDQRPELVDRAEWANTTKHRVCQTKLGEVRRATAHSRILEKIRDSLWHLAPE
jgi:hypothetical protein